MILLIAKERIIPLRILKNEALLKRLPLDYPKRHWIEQDLTLRKPGFHGEVAIEYYINQLPAKEYTVLHNLRLPSGQNNFEIDTLLLSPHFALILEIKNYKGTLYFDSKFNQLIRIFNGKEDGFSDPIPQAERQKTELGKWLASKKISLPIDYLVVISKPSTIIKVDPNYYLAFQKVLHAHELLNRIEKIRRRYTEEKLTLKERKKLAKLLLKNHDILSYNALEYFQIPETALLTGVHCPSCGALPILRVRGIWQCPKCDVKSKDAHIQALKDYFLLINSSISNQQFRDFVHLQSPNTAKKMLTSLNLPYSGENKCRKYHSDGFL